MGAILSIGRDGFMERSLSCGQLVYFASEVRALCMTWPGSGTRSNSHAVAARGSCTKIPLASGEGSGGRDHSSNRLFQAIILVGSSTWIGRD